MAETEPLRKLRTMEARLRLAGVRALYLFGSVARSADNEISDIDLLFEAEADRPFSLMDQARLQVDLSTALGKPVDLIERAAMHPGILRQAEAEMVRVF